MSVIPGLNGSSLSPNPESNEDLVEQVALNLCCEPRWLNGSPIPSNVLYHSLRVGHELRMAGQDDYIVALGLGHDFGEAWLGDIPGPTKNDIESKYGVDFDEIENHYRGIVFEELGLRESSESEWRAMKRADRTMAAFEAQNFYENNEDASEIASEFDGDELLRSPEEMEFTEWDAYLARPRNPDTYMIFLEELDRNSAVDYSIV